MKNIDGVYLCTNDFVKKTQLYLLTNNIYYCSEIIDGMIKIFITDKTSVFMSFEEFSKHFYCVKETRRKKIDSIRKSVGLFNFK